MSELYIKNIIIACLNDDLNYIMENVKNQSEKDLSLIYACINNKLKIAEYLISIGADYNNQEALIAAAVKDHNDILNFLLDKGAKLPDNLDTIKREYQKLLK